MTTPISVNNTTTPTTTATALRVEVKTTRQYTPIQLRAFADTMRKLILKKDQLIGKGLNMK